MSRYAVFDLETTGLSPAHGHRVVEVAVVLVDDNGGVVYEWDTLVNPQRDVGASDIHGLTGADLCHAPTFDQIAGELASLLTDRVPVAHNLSFDSRFLAAEFMRFGYDVPLTPTNGLCTMRIAGHYLPGSSRTLEACCDCIGCTIQSSHAALDDARAASALLAHYMREDDDFAASWLQVISAAQRSAWPDIPSDGSCRCPRSHSRVRTDEHFLARLASHAPRSEVHPEANSYLAVLDRVLLDRYVSYHEADELVSLADMLGISRDEAMRIHGMYLTSLASVALADGIVTEDERRDLTAVAGLLGLSGDTVDSVLKNAGAGNGDDHQRGTAFSLEVGDRIVFTGEAPGIDRSDLEYQAACLGYKVTGAVSGKTKLVVAADPDSLSGKARKARELGIPIVDYRSYSSMIG